MPGVTRWEFVDPHAGASPASYTFAINPNRMTSPWLEKKLDLSVSTAADGMALVSEGQSPPKEWQFGGAILNQAHHDNLALWLRKTVRIYLYDHFRRRYTIYPLTLDMTPIKWSPAYPFRHQYTMTVLTFADPVYTVTPVPLP